MPISSRKTQPSIFEVYKYQAEYVAKNLVLEPSTIHQSWCLSAVGIQKRSAGLEGFHGYGKFHTIAPKDQDVEKQLLVVWNRDSVQVFCIHDQWTLLNKISFAESVCTNPLRVCHGRHFAWTFLENDVVSFWDMDHESLVHVILRQQSDTQGDTYVDISQDESRAAICRDGLVTVHEMETGMEIGTYKLPGQPAKFESLHFISGDTQLMMSFCREDKNIGCERKGVILDVASMAVVNKYNVLDSYSPYFIPGATSNQLVLSHHGSKLDLIALNDKIIQPYSNQDQDCNDQCIKAPFRLRGQEKVFDSPCGLRFHVERRSPTKHHVKNSDSQSIVVLMSTGEETLIEKLVLPPAPSRMRGLWTYKHAVILARKRQFVVESSKYIMIWNLPKTMAEDLELILVWETKPDQAPEEDIWGVCEHHQLYDLQRSTSAPYIRSQAFCEKTGDQFLGGIKFVIGIYAMANETCKKAILRYVNTHINSGSDILKESVLTRICDDWTSEQQGEYEHFVTALLDEPFASWLPKPQPNILKNPLSKLLIFKTMKEPQAVGLAEIIIDYCIRQAKSSKNTLFLFPVLHCMCALIHPKYYHAELALRTLRQLAYLPVKSRSFIFHHHTISHPPESPLRFWAPRSPRLHMCRDPVLQLARTCKHDPLNENFHRALFVARFDMLWLSVDPFVQAPRPPTTEKPILLIKILCYMIWRKRKLFISKAAPSQSFNMGVYDNPKKAAEIQHSRDTDPEHYRISECQRRLYSAEHVKCHEFTLEMLDNPAIAALVEYKWNTIAFYYWLIRFLCQLCYYILILTAVLLQVYSQGHPALYGLFVAITVYSCIFLWLEMIQLSRTRMKYFRSIYNIADIGAFGLPLAGSINQLLIYDGKISGFTPQLVNGWLFSFAILAISIHFLLELRINRTVCHFVTIIIRIIVGIRVFFFIFFGGILAFTVALLHLLHSCAYDSCEEFMSNLEPGPKPSGEFPRHFFHAISTTYFLMGGRYEPLNDVLNSENWALHSVMIVYFFFTVILMLNVLIALVNVAFTVSDGTWRLVWIRNRMRYVEMAENMSYHIPGFRESYNCFPEEIYYSATPQQMMAFEIKYLSDESSQISSSGKASRKYFGRALTSKANIASSFGNSVEDLERKFKKGLQEQEKSLKDDFRKALEEQRREQHE
ncbi:hypothetical protein BG011_007344 [Mortierella polycephala]|uniref:Ion transport domain-containing protein n=1 Tax=Mortierella polycephala TaxID=41804 RepID=A0A9P6PTT3_9FUNG|nr:hypothetical protein BG011_007344 [Mortierella polycephala]